MSIMIEKATSLDAALILKYLKQVGGETDNLTFGPEGMPFTVAEEASFIAQTEHSCDDIMLVAKETGKIVGIASLSRLPRRMGHRGDCSISVLFSTFCSKRIPIHSHMVPIIANEYAIFNLFRDFLLKFTLDDITINNTISIDSAKNVVIV